MKNNLKETDSTKSNLQKAKPFLRWAGGKNRIANFLEDHLSQSFTNGKRYYEPFLGAGSLFFRLNPSKATLSDNNKDLIECYKAVKKRPLLIANYLKQHLSNNCKDYYYNMRYKYNNSCPSISKAALFIYLNKTCFNGIWRVNKKGQFNVPYGYKERPALPTRDELINLSKTLSRAEVIHRDYKDIIKYAEKGDFIYFDPPYPPLNGTSYFTHYTKEGFDKNDHAELASIANILDKKGCNLMISNADIPFIRSLYEDKFILHELDVIRFIRADGKRYKVQELVITNYEI